METERRPTRRRALGALAGLSLAGVIGAGIVAGRPPANGLQEPGANLPAPVAPARRLDKLAPWSKSKCQTYPWLKFDKPLYKHLGNKGPKYGKGDGEGLVYRTIDMGTGAGSEQGRKVLLILNATNTDYKPFSPRLNGMQGFYGSVNLHSGSDLSMKMSFRDEETGKRLTMPELALTFFDLDSGHEGRSTESVAVNKYKHWYLTDNTEVQRSTLPHGMTKYSASTYGDGDDNPKDPMLLTDQQKNRAVTMLFENVDEIDVKLAASSNPHTSPRFFTFVLRPSLLCAITLARGQKKPLAVLDYTPPMELPVPCADGMVFQKWLTKVGAHVKRHDPIALMKDKSGQEIKLKAPRKGTVKQLAGLLPHESCDDRLMDTTLAVIKMDFLKPLPHLSGFQKAAQGADGETFVKYKEPVGASVEEGDVIAVLKDDKGKEVDLRAPHDGTIRAEQEHLRKGDPIEKVTDENLATYTKISELKPEGWRAVGVKCDPGAIFKAWKVKKGDYVEMGDPIAEVELPSRRLADGRMLAGSIKTITAPAWGTVQKEQPLQPGGTIRAQQVGPTIATIDMGLPWWIWLLACLCGICGLLCCIFVGMAKPKPEYAPMPPIEEEPPAPEPEPKEEPPAPEPIPEPVPEGLRLDFQDGTEVRTVYAQWRPLGIKHNEIAPIVAHDFTLNSYAKQELGVKDGWKLRRIGDEELHDNPNFEKVNDKLSHHMKDFPLWPLSMSFIDDSGTTHKVKFVQRPLGIEFTNQAPIKASKVHAESPAADQNVQEGWQVSKIGDQDVRDNANFREVMTYLHEGVIPLDDHGKKFT